MPTKKDLKTNFIFTVEHAVPFAPLWIKNRLNLPPEEWLSHKAYDQGALKLAKQLAKLAGGKVYSARLSRLVLDHNRSFSISKPFSKQALISLTKKEREAIRRSYYQKYRGQIEKTLHRSLQTNRRTVILSVHSFTPIFKGKHRQTDLGLLFDYRHPKERKFAQHIKNAFHTHWPELRVHFNLPYRGHTDCFLNDLIKSHGRNFLFESLFLEMNQNLISQISRVAKILEIALSFEKGS